MLVLDSCGRRGGGLAAGMRWAVSRRSCTSHREVAASADTQAPRSAAEPPAAACPVWQSVGAGLVQIGDITSEDVRQADQCHVAVFGLTFFFPFE